MKELINSTEIKDEFLLDETYLKTKYLCDDMCGTTESGLATEGCTTDYSLSSIKQLVDVWSNSNLKDSDLIADDLGYKTRLITYDELIANLGYENVLGTMAASPSMENTPEWVYSLDYSYWTMTPSEDSNHFVWVDSQRLESTGVYLYSTVRPVITLKKQNYNIDDNNPNNSQIVKVPDALLNKSVIGILIGVILMVISIIVFVIIRENKNIDKKDN